MPKPRAVVRQWTLLRALSQHKGGMTILEMARDMGVNTRTIRRDINLFVQAGVPLREVIGRRGTKTWRIDGLSLAAPAFSVEEAFAILVAERLLAPLPGTQLYSATKRCGEKIALTLSPPQRAILEKSVKWFASQWDGGCVSRTNLMTLNGLVQSIPFA
jgi:predicted DNA-binding transcriptional regulator YafY